MVTPFKIFSSFCVTNLQKCCQFWYSQSKWSTLLIVLAFLVWLSVFISCDWLQSAGSSCSVSVLDFSFNSTPVILSLSFQLNFLFPPLCCCTVLDVLLQFPLLLMKHTWNAHSQKKLLVLVCYLVPASSESFIITSTYPGSCP